MQAKARGISVVVRAAISYYDGYGDTCRGVVHMISKEQYREIEERIIALVDEVDPSIDSAALLEELRREGISREVGTTMILEMIGAGYISRRAEDWQLTSKQEASTGVGVHAR
jgi:hypothetical protein